MFHNALDIVAGRKTGSQIDPILSRGMLYDLSQTSLLLLASASSVQPGSMTRTNLEYQPNRAPDDTHVLRLNLNEDVDNVKVWSKRVGESCDLGATRKQSAIVSMLLTNGTELLNHRLFTLEFLKRLTLVWGYSLPEGLNRIFEQIPWP